MKPKELLTNVANGQYKIAFDQILSNNHHINAEDVLKVVEAICASCTKNQANIDDKSLVLLLKECTTRIKQPDAAVIHRYFKAVYYIVKHLTETGQQYLIQLEEVIAPSFISEHLPENSKCYIENLSHLLYNKIWKAEEIDSVMFGLTILSLKVLKEAVSPEKYFKGLQNFLALFHSRKVNIQVIKRIYEKGLQIFLQRGMRDVPDSIFISFANVFKCLLNIFIGNHLNQMSDIIDVSLANMEKFSKNGLHKHLCSVLRAFFVLYDCPPSTTIITCLKKAAANLAKCSGDEGHEDMIIVFDIIFKLLEYMNYYCFREMSTEKWKMAMTEEVQISILQLLEKMSLSLAKVKQRCPCNPNCTANSGTSKSFKFGITTVTFCALSVSKNLDYSKNLYAQIFHCVVHLNHLLHSLKDKECTLFKDNCTSFASKIFQMSVLLSKAENPIAEKLFKLLLALPRAYYEEHVITNVLDGSFKWLADIYMMQKNYEKALFYSAVRIAYQISDPKHALAQWVKIKYAASDNAVLKKATATSFLKKNPEKVEKLCGLILDGQKETMLLTMELRQYKSHYASKDSMLSTFKELKTLTDTQTLAVVFVEIWGSSKINAAHEELSSLLEEITTDLKQKCRKMVDHDYNFGCLEYCRYKFKRDEIIRKNKKEMQNIVHGLKKPSQAADGVVLNEHDKCDIITIYENLNYETFLKHQQHLSNAMLSLTKYVEESSKDCDKLKNCLDILKEIAHEYQLHFITHEMLQAWLLVVKTAEILNDELSIVEGIAFILEATNVNTTNANKIIDYAQDIISRITCNKPEQHQVMVLYYLSKSYANVRHGRLSEAFADFKQAESVYCHLPESQKANLLLKSKLLHLQYEFCRLSCKHAVLDHQENFALKLYQGFHTIMGYVKSEEYDSTNSLSLFFDITEKMTEMYHWMRLPREMRCYGREVMILAQQLVLPSRAARLLAVLAQADLLSLRFDDCRVKINGISSILNESRETFFSCASQCKGNEGISNDVLVEQFEVMTLDIPHQPGTRLSPGSPALKVEPFKLPFLINHCLNCECFGCNSIEFQRHFMAKAYLEGLLSLYENSAESKMETQTYFSGVLEMYSSFRNKGQYNTNRYEQLMRKQFPVKLNGEGFIEDTQFALRDIYNSVLLDYGNYLLRCGKDSNAAQLNDKLVSNIDQLNNVWLYNEAMFQKMVILDSRTSSKVSTQHLTVNDAEASISPSIIKTPESHVSKVQVTKPNVSPDVTPAKKPVKIVPFVLIADDIKSPCKINVYTPATRTRKKVKQAHQLQATPASTTTTKDVLNTAFVTPNSKNINSRVEQNLRSQSKLLAEKIRQSTKKESAIKQVDSGNIKKPVSKKLLNEECSSKENAKDVPQLKRRVARQNKS